MERFEDAEGVHRASLRAPCFNKLLTSHCFAQRGSLLITPVCRGSGWCRRSGMACITPNRMGRVTQKESGVCQQLLLASPQLLFNVYLVKDALLSTTHGHNTGTQIHRATLLYQQLHPCWVCTGVPCLPLPAQTSRAGQLCSTSRETLPCQFLEEAEVQCCCPVDVCYSTGMGATPTPQH